MPKGARLAAVAAVLGALAAGSRAASGLLEFRPRADGRERRSHEPVFFDDGFARDADEDDPWDVVSGEWKLAAFRDPKLSTNPFKYCGRSRQGAAAEAVTGGRDWRDYRFAASARLLKGASESAAFGLSICRSARGLYALKLSPGKGTAELLRIVGGKETLLAREKTACEPGVWYRVELEASGGSVRGLVDGHEIVSARERSLAAGRAGLHLEGDIAAEFDDVSARPAACFEADFDDAHPAAPWECASGKWRLEELDGAGARGCSLALHGNSAGFLLAGEAGWEDYEFAADVLPRDRPSGGFGSDALALVFNARDAENYMMFRWRGGQDRTRSRQIVKVAGGEETVLAVAPGPYRTGGWHRLKVSTRAGHVACSIDGSVVAEAVGFDTPRGRIGLKAGALAGGAFDNVRVTFPRTREASRRVNTLFARQETMKAWSRESSAWESGRDGVAWHSGELRGDCAVVVEGIGQGKGCELVVSADAPGAEGGYGMVFGPASGGGPTAWTASIRRAGVAVASEGVPAPRGRYSARLARRGRWVIGYVNGEGVVKFEDPEPLAGRRVGFRADAEEAGVECERFLDYTFHTAPVDWEPVSGEWGTTQRWACDPRWSFFGGRSRNVAAIWSKRAFRGDLTVEIYCAPGTHVEDYSLHSATSLEGVYQYSHPSDLNVTVCGDGADPESGYAFVFNGWDRSRNAIVRARRIVAQNRKYLFATRGVYDGRYNRHWFRIVVEKRASRLRHYVDGKLVLEYDDPVPLDSGRIALWTKNNRLLIGRVRIYFDDEARE